LPWPFGAGWRIWSAEAEVASWAWIYPKDVLVATDTAFDRSHTVKCPRCFGDSRARLHLKAVSAVAGAPNTK
jgi:hypothetical protein